MLLSRRMGVARQLLSPLGVALALIAAALFFGGSAGDGSIPWLGAAAVAAAVVLAATCEAPHGLLALLPLGALAVWCAASIAWSIEPDRSWDYANRTAVYVAFAVVGAYLAGRTGELALGTAALLGAVCVWALATKVVPGLYEDYGRIARLRAPVGYWNALALLGDIALPLGLWLAGRRRSAGTLLVYGWAIAIALTSSRGGVIVAVVIVVAWIALSGAWIAGTTTLVAAGIPAAGVIALALKLHGITSDGQTHATRVHDGIVFGAALVAGALVAALFAQLPEPVSTPGLRTAAAILASVVSVIALIVAATHAHSWWDEFSSPATPELSNSESRLVEAGSNHRWVWWKEAWHAFEHHAVAGTGAGSFSFTNLRLRTTSLDSTTEPHNLPLQFLTETGVVGAALLVGGALLLIILARRRSDAELALSLALPAYLLHGLLDIDWDFAAVSAPVFLIAGALAARAAQKRRGFSFPAALAASGVGIVVLLSLFTVWLGNRYANDAGLSASPAHAVALAKRARELNPFSVDPITTEALAEEQLANATHGTTAEEHLGLAHGLFLKATSVQPEDPYTWYALGEFELELGCARHALTRFERFYELDSQDPGVAEKDKALKLVNSGKPPC
jgi:hypothetical protein